MREEFNEKLDRYRGKLFGAVGDEYRGTFQIPYKFMPVGKKNPMLTIVSSGPSNPGDEGVYAWEHVSISTRVRCPTWSEMCWIKDLFWTDEETVVQFHPPKNDHVNQHKYCLHLWKPPYEVILPPTIAVGMKDAPNHMRY